MAFDMWINILIAENRSPGEWVEDGMALEPNVTPKTNEKMKRFAIVDNDILIADYPKTGDI